MSEGTGEDAPKIELQNLIIAQANDNVKLENIGGLGLISMSDAATILLEYVALATENGEDFLTEDNQILTVQG